LLLTCLAVPVLADTLPKKHNITLPLVFDTQISRQLPHALDIAYGALGIKVNYEQMPGPRALIESNAGRMDGELTRTSTVEESAPNLRRIDVPMSFFVTSAIVLKNSRLAPTSLDAVSKMPSVGIVRGLNTPEHLTRGWPNITSVPSQGQALKMLQLGRIDVLLAGDEGSRDAIKTNHLNERDFEFHAIARLPTFHYLHKSNEALVPLVSAELMKFKGSHASVLDAVRAGAGANTRK
jgi:ABC-type amino acid transport substrate-binding protein